MQKLAGLRPLVLSFVVAHPFAMAHSWTRIPGRSRLGRLARALTFGLALFPVPPVAAAVDSFRLTDDELTARADARTELTVDIDGRYSITAKRHWVQHYA